MKDTYNIARRFCFNVISQTDGDFATFLKGEYKDFIIDENCCTEPCTGVLEETTADLFNGERRELVKDMLYEDCRYIYLKYNSKFVRINLTDECFAICYQTGFEHSVLFHLLEDILRLYAHRYGLDFFHASSFEFNDKVIMLNGFGGSGKTEIMIDFLLRGATFISDDLVLINEEGKIYPYRVTIPLRWGVVTPEFVARKKVPPIIYKTCKYCHEKPGRITNRIYGKLVWHYLIGDHSYKQISDKESTLQFYNVDYCYWLQEANVDGTFNISRADFLRYMDLCLENESRKYLDIEGFLSLKFPIVTKLKKGRQHLREQLCETLTPQGLAVKNRDFKQATIYILDSIK